MISVLESGSDRALAGVIVLCSLAYLTKMLLGYLRWTSIPSRGGSDTLSRFMLWRLELSAGRPDKPFRLVKRL